MNEVVKKYWRWKSTIIDFKTLSDEKADYSDYAKKKDIVFRYLGTPDEDINEWYNGGYSSEYNEALRYGIELNLVEYYVDNDDIIYNLEQENTQLKKQIDEVKEILNHCDSGQICDEITEWSKIILQILNDKVVE